MEQNPESLSSDTTEKEEQNTVRKMVYIYILLYGIYPPVMGIMGYYILLYNKKNETQLKNISGTRSRPPKSSRMLHDLLTFRRKAVWHRDGRDRRAPVISAGAAAGAGGGSKVVDQGTSITLKRRESMGIWQNKGIEHERTGGWPKNWSTNCYYMSL